MLYRLPLILTATLAVSACAIPPAVTRNAPVATLEALPVQQQEADLRRQADDLTARTAEILRKSTLRGAGIGAAAGCGLGLATGTGATNCVSGALAGGAVGAAAGYANGKAEVARRIEIIDPSPLVSGMAKANAAMEGIQADLPSVIAAQDAELLSLMAARDAGQVSDAAYAARLAEISQLRQRLAAALELSGQQARETVAALRAAQGQGQEGLDWHLHQAMRLGQETTSARSAITLL